MFKDIVRGNEIIEEKIHNAVIKQTRLAHLEVLSAIQEQIEIPQKIPILPLRLLHYHPYRTPPLFKHRLSWHPT